MASLLVFDLVTYLDHKHFVVAQSLKSNLVIEIFTNLFQDDSSVNTNTYILIDINSTHIFLLDVSEIDRILKRLSKLT